MLGSKVQLAPPTVNICGKAYGRANSELTPKFSHQR